MTEPISDEQLEVVRNWQGIMIPESAAKIVPALTARIDLERNRADEAVKDRDTARELADEGWQWEDDLCDAIGPDTTVFTFKDDLAKLHAAEAECERLRGVVEAAKALKDVMSSTDRFDWPMSGNVRAGYDDLRDALDALASLAPKPKEPM